MNSNSLRSSNSATGTRTEPNGQPTGIPKRSRLTVDLPFLILILRKPPEIIMAGLPNPLVTGCTYIPPRRPASSYHPSRSLTSPWFLPRHQGWPSLCVRELRGTPGTTVSECATPCHSCHQAWCYCSKKKRFDTLHGLTEVTG